MEAWEENFSQARRMWDRGSGEKFPEYNWLRLRCYVSLLYQWSGQMSLVSAGDRDFLATRHCLPAWRWLPIITAIPHRTLLDLGSGAGLPGLPLKIVLPETHVYLVESRRRRVHFLREVIRRLELDKVSVVHSRLEDWDGIESGVDIVISRAVMSLPALIRLVSSFLAPHGCILAHLHSEEAENLGVGYLLRRERDNKWGGGWMVVLSKEG